MKVFLAVDRSPCSNAAIEAVLAEFLPAHTEVRVFEAADWERRLPDSYAFAEGAAAARAVLDWREKALNEARHDLQLTADRLRAAGFAATFELSKEGEPAAAILDAAARWGADLIVLGSHGRSALDRFLLGSVSDRVVRHAHCSVQVVRPRASMAA
jgi:nucleotide-binding universal stress UspA family protein